MIQFKGAFDCHVDLTLRYRARLVASRIDADKNINIFTVLRKSIRIQLQPSPSEWTDDGCRHLPSIFQILQHDRGKKILGCPTAGFSILGDKNFFHEKTIEACH